MTAMEYAQRFNYMIAIKLCQSQMIASVSCKMIITVIPRIIHYQLMVSHKIVKWNNNNDNNNF